MVSFKDRFLVNFCNLKFIELLLCFAGVTVQVIVSMRNYLILTNNFHICLQKSAKTILVLFPKVF